MLMERKVVGVDTRIDLYKAVKWEVAIAFGDHGMNLPEMWKAVHESSWWRKICLEDYQEGMRD